MHSSLEPTVVPPVLLDLCTVAILHRFSSPSWWEHLAQHVSADISADDAFDRVVRLEVRRYVQGLYDWYLISRVVQTGEAIVLAPSGFGVFPDGPQVSVAQGAQRTVASIQIPKLNQFGRRYILMKTRRRVTKDGGASILVVED